MKIVDIEKIDQIIQIILVVSGEEDDYRDRDLGPIHIIKYLYLADLEFAKRHKGETFSGLPWRFYHFGPWAAAVIDRIDPALEKIGAEKKHIRSKLSDDFVRWSPPKSNDLYFSLIQGVPQAIVSALRQYIHKFTNDTEELLHFVYRTKPMLQAKPNEHLNFGSADLFDDRQTTKQEVIPEKKLSKQSKIKRKQFLCELKSKMQTQSKRKAKTFSTDFEPPIYDEVFFQGLETFDKISGKKIESSEGSVVFSDDVWKSEARYDPELSG